MRICLFDPAIENHENHPSSNLGDLIIGAAVERELCHLFPHANVLRLSTQAPLKWNHLLKMLTCPVRIVGGTNLLSSFMDRYKQWQIDLPEARLINKAILLGVGWWQYQKAPNEFTRVRLKAALSDRALHSVRDNYTLEKLATLGINNAINTGCPTMWPLGDMPASSIPRSKATTCLTMLTDYLPNPEADTALLDLLTSQYETVVFWPQGRRDLEDLAKLAPRNVIPLEHSMEALSRFISDTPSFDYVGTRLHGGVHCLLHKRRSLIIEIDNRAHEIAMETNLPSAARGNLQAVQQWIEGEAETSIRINKDAVDRWRAQFRPGA
jgi:polysaccharide pyruvyl transferase WcaK-like protein